MDSVEHEAEIDRGALVPLMGRGIVEPVDDFRESNPPSNPGLLEALTDDLVSHGMQLKPLVALIMKSQTDQLEATPTTSPRPCSGLWVSTRPPRCETA